MIKKILLPSAVLLAMVLQLSGAQYAKALTLTPPTLDISVKPGDTAQGTLKLYNETNKDLQLYGDVRVFQAKDETGEPEFGAPVPVGADQGLAGNVQIEKGPFTLKAGERKEETFKITVPSNMTPGGKYLGIFFTEQAPAATTTKEQVQVNSSLGVLVFVTVAGDVMEKGNVVELMSDKGFYSHLPATLSTRFQNTGNVHLRPTGDVVVKNMFGSQQAKLTVNETDGATLPQSTRKYDVTWSRGTSDDGKGFFAELRNEWINFGFGKYTATVNVTFGKTSQLADTATVSFWVFPWRTLLLFVIVLALVGGGFVMMHQKHEDEKAEMSGSNNNNRRLNV